MEDSRIGGLEVWGIGVLVDWGWSSTLDALGRSADISSSSRVVVVAVVVVVVVAVVEVVVVGVAVGCAQ